MLEQVSVSVVVVSLLAGLLLYIKSLRKRISFEESKEELQDEREAVKEKLSKMPLERMVDYFNKYKRDRK